MTQTIDPRQAVEIIAAMARAVAGQQAELSALDSTVGDGDHGVNITLALQEAAQQVSQLENPTLETVWRTAGKAIQNSVGGASGLLFGAFFVAASRTLTHKQNLTLTDVVEMLAAGLAEVQKRGQAQPGDRTLIDALAPALSTAQVAAENRLPLDQALQQIAQAASAGAEATRHMVAKHGRAKFLGERSRGYQDAGATSMAVMLTAWADWLNKA